MASNAGFGSLGRTPMYAPLVHAVNACLVRAGALSASVAEVCALAFKARADRAIAMMKIAQPNCFGRGKCKFVLRSNQMNTVAVMKPLHFRIRESLRATLGPIRIEDNHRVTLIGA